MGGISRTYIDTSHILALVFDESGKLDMNRLFSRLKSNSFHVLIPQLVLGEAISRILARCPHPVESGRLVEKLHRIFVRYDVDVTMCLPTATKDAFEIMTAIRDGDEWITSDDTGSSASRS